MLFFFSGTNFGTQRWQQASLWGGIEAWCARWPDPFPFLKQIFILCLIFVRISRNKFKIANEKEKKIKFSKIKFTLHSPPPHPPKQAFGLSS